MSQPWEAHVSDTSAALSVYNCLCGVANSTQRDVHGNERIETVPFALSLPHSTTVEIEAYGGALEGDLAPSSAFYTRGFAWLVSHGFVTIGGGGTITATNVDGSGNPKLLRRVFGDDSSLEVVP